MRRQSDPARRLAALSRNADDHHVRRPGTDGAAADGSVEPGPTRGWLPKDEPLLVDDGPDAPPATRGPAWGLLRRRDRLAEKWVPDAMRHARIDPGRRGAVLLAVVAAVAAVVAAVGVWRDRPQVQPVPVSLGPGTAPASAQPASSSTGQAGAQPTEQSTLPSVAGASPPAEAPTSAPSGPIFVSVTGAVRTPGLVRLAPGARVADAIAAAGGVSADGTLTGLNLAQPLGDGDSVVVGEDREPPASGSVGGSSRGPPAGGGTEATGATAAPAAAIDLNTADQQQLETLPGVGPVMAGNIVAWREANGPFTSVEQLQEISGIGPARYAQLVPLVTV